MQIANLSEAKTQLSRLVNDAAYGEEIIIARAGMPADREGKSQQSCDHRQASRSNALLKLDGGVCQWTARSINIAAMVNKIDDKRCENK